MNLTTTYIDRLISRLWIKAEKYNKNDKVDKLIRCLSAIAYTKYTFYKGYRDEKIEKLAVQISHEFISQEIYSQKGNVVVMYDSFCSDNKGLSEQYLDALISCGLKVVYIHRRPLDEPVCKNIQEMIKSSDSVEDCYIGKQIKGRRRVEAILQKIVEVNPSRLFMQIMPNDIEEVIAFNALPKEIIRYQINLTDHTFWVGTSCMDYSLEFRGYGCQLSIKERGIDKERILLQPFYPVMKKTPFQGFPKRADGKFIFFTGASSPYKMIDDDLTFFKLCKQIVEVCPTSVVLIAGGSAHDDTISRCLEKVGAPDSIIPIGNRTDIYEVFKHVDVFINTFPIGGGLMSQFAAQCKKPILNYLHPNVEEIVGQKNACHFTCYSIEEFINEAKHLYSDKEYREQKGEYVNSVVISPKEFNDNLRKAIYTNISVIKFAEDNNFEVHPLDINGAIRYCNSSKCLHYALFSILGNDLFCISPMLYLSLFCHKVFKKIEIWKRRK